LVQKESENLPDLSPPAKNSIGDVESAAKKAWNSPEKQEQQQKGNPKRDDTDSECDRKMGSQISCINRTSEHRLRTWSTTAADCAWKATYTHLSIYPVCDMRFPCYLQKRNLLAKHHRLIVIQRLGHLDHCLRLDGRRELQAIHSLRMMTAAILPRRLATSANLMKYNWPGREGKERTPSPYFTFTANRS
jgi:hypothetical protein